MMKRYKIGNNFYWYEEGSQPANAEVVEPKNEKTDNAVVEVKIQIPKNKSKGVKAK